MFFSWIFLVASRYFIDSMLFMFNFNSSTCNVSDRCWTFVDSIYSIPSFISFFFLKIWLKVIFQLCWFKEKTKKKTILITVLHSLWNKILLNFNLNWGVQSTVQYYQTITINNKWKIVSFIRILCCFFLSFFQYQCICIRSMFHFIFIL